MGAAEARRQSRQWSTPSANRQKRISLSLFTCANIAHSHILHTEEAQRSCTERKDIMEPQDLKAWRERNNLTQQAAADALEISRRTLVAYEQGESDIPRVVEFACSWLDKNPAAIEPRDRFRMGLTEGGTAGTRDVAIATFSLLKHTLARLKGAGVLSSEMLLQICNAAIKEHIESPAGDQPWTAPVGHLIQDTYYDLEPSKASKRRQGFFVDTNGTPRKVFGMAPPESRLP
jgi:DNA-binding transcriptional regulator YiaG